MMEQSESPSGRASFNEEPIVSSGDYYAILESPPNASGDALGGSYNRIYNRIIALQHNSPQTENTANAFRELKEAYEVLSDPVKRRAYDRRNQPPVINTPSSESMVGRAFAIVSRFKVQGGPSSVVTPAPSTSGLAPDMLDTVGIMCQQGGIEGALPMDPRVSVLTWGTGIEGKVDRQAANYYRLSVSPDEIENGFIIFCKSVSKDKFKLVMFDSSGTLLIKEECSRAVDRQSTEVTLFFLNSISDTTQGSPYQYTENPLSVIDPNGITVDSDGSNREKVREIHSPLSDKMDSAVSTKHPLQEGQYLLCLYGDNLMVKTSYNLIAVMAKNDAPEVKKKKVYFIRIF